MKILLLGGPRFLGYALIESALKRDHEITLFNRGRTNPDLYPEVVKLVGDRDGGLDVLKGRRWDAVIDTCGYLPRVVRSSAEFLKRAVKQYVFISSISVYADEATPRQDESAAVGKIAEPNTETITGETYGPLKYLCEQAVEKVFRLLPDVALMDILMPVMSGLEATRQIKNQCPQTRVLILTQYDEQENMLVASQAGAYGFIPKKAASEQLIAGIRAVYGGTYFPESYAKLVSN